MSFAFFNTLFPESDNDGRDWGYVVLALFPGGKFGHPDGISQMHYFAWPSRRDDLVAFCLSNQHKDIYTVPALYRERGNRKASNISHQWAVYADADALDLRKLRAEPTMVVETSPGRHHLYWITSSDDPKALVEISKAIAHTHAADGCDSGGWDGGQLLRVPGTSNNKPEHVDEGGYGFEVQLKSLGAPYGLNRLAEIYPPVSVPQAETDWDVMPDPKEWDYHPERIAEARDIYDENPNIHLLAEEEITPTTDRSKKMWLLLGELARAGASRHAAMFIAWHAKCNKWRLNGKAPEVLWRELCKAYEHPLNRPVSNSFEAAELSILKGDRSRLEQSEENPENRVKDFVSTITILRPGEEPPDDTFVDRYATWAATRTDAPAVYHRAGAVTILTSVFGEFGTCPTKFETNLTLWFLLLGPTTRARKTTAMMLWVDMLGDLQNDAFDYLLGSDITSEGLSVVLPKRDGRTSVFFRDEAHGLLYEQDKKRYMAGLREHMTELYGGRVRMRIRASTAYSDDDPPKGNIKTNFVMFLCGTLDQVTSALTIEDYQSGHLARFLVAEASPPPMTKDDMYIEQYEGTDTADDIVRNALISDLTAARNFWLHKVGGIGRKPRAVPFAQDAWDRLQDAKWDIYETALNHDLSEVLLPTTDRMGSSVMKCAVLLAMSEESERVEMRHVLKAMSLAEDWYAATATIAGKILHSTWSALQEEMLTAVRSRIDGITQQELYSRYRTRVPERDIESALNVLMKAGLIAKVPEKGRIRYRITPRA